MFYFIFLRTVQTILNCSNYAPTLCSPNSPFHQPTVPTGCSSDSSIDLIEVAAVTVALVGAAKERRFIFSYFLSFLRIFIFSYLLFFR